MSDLADAAGSGVTEEIGGKTFQMGVIDLKDLGQLERQALQSFRREYIKTYRDNVELLPEESRDQAVAEAFERAAMLDVESLPMRQSESQVYDSDGNPKKDRKGRLITRLQKVPYAAWWIGSTFDGMLHMVWLSMKKEKPDMTLDDAAKLITSDGGESRLAELAATVDEISAPNLVKNLEGTPAT